MTWTAERIDELTRLWKDGHSASTIGKMLGISKNAVVGKAHRLQLPSRPSPIRRGSSTSQPRRRQASLQVPPTKITPIKEAGSDEASAQQAREVRSKVEQAPTEPQIGRPAPEKPKVSRSQVTLARRKSAPLGAQNCQWPIGDPSDSDFHFCGEPAAAGKPYCDSHCEKAYIRKSRDSEAA